MPPRAIRVRPYTGDFLTLPKAGNWTLQFRVPEHLRGLPPFGNKVVFKKSLRTKDRALALKLKDQFLREVGFDEPNLDRDRVRAEKTMKAPDFYFEHLNALDTSQGIGPLLVLSEEISGLIMDVQQAGGSQKQIDKLKAQLAATERAIDEVSAGGRSYEKQHLYQVTLKTAVERFGKEAEHRGLPKKTIGKARTALARFVTFIEHNPTLVSIRRPRVVAYWKALRADGKSKAVVANDLSFLGAAFKQAIDEGLLPDSTANPFREHRLEGFAPKVRRSVYNKAQLNLIFDHLRQDAELQAAVYVGYYSGLRLAEIFTAKLRNEAGIFVLSVAEQGGKTASAKRLVPVHAELMNALKALGYWPDLDSPLPWQTSSAQALGKRFGRAKDEVLAALPLKDRKTYTFHSLRHGFVTMLIENGYNELQIADISGHSKSGSKTEAGRTYTSRQQLPTLASIVATLPSLRGPTA